jgi:hypothetical protein
MRWPSALDFVRSLRPDNGATWQLRVQVQFMFPK